MVNPSPSQPEEQIPVNQPNIPMQYMNGHQGWYIVIEDNGEQVIELVDSSSDEEPDPPPAPAPDPVAHVDVEGAVPAAGLDINDEDEIEVAAVELVDIGIQVDVLEMAYLNHVSGSEHGSDTASEDSDAMDVDDEGADGYDLGQSGHCHGCGRQLSTTHGLRSVVNRGRRSHRFYGKKDNCF